MAEPAPVPAPVPGHPTLRVRPEQEQELCTWVTPSGAEAEPQQVCVQSSDLMIPEVTAVSQSVS